ncbi:hypothetical protein ACFLSA_06895 [Bacteroidota bacterium]
MKARYVPFQILKASLLLPLLLISCEEETGKPEFISARIDDEDNNTVFVVFSDEIYSTGLGFFIFINDTETSIDDVEGNGSSTLRFILEESIQYGDEVTIEYDAAIGDAEGGTGKELRSFGPRTIRNYVIEKELRVILPSIPPEYRYNRVWLILRTDEEEVKWTFDYNSALVNSELTASPAKIPFDLIVHITKDDKWRPEDTFSTGYYITKLNQTSRNLQLKAVSWIRSDSLWSTDMGYFADVSKREMNDSQENAYLLRTDSTDYVQGIITSVNDELFYTFYAENNEEYRIVINDYINESSYFTGGVEAIVLDRYGIQLEDKGKVISDFPLDITGDGEFLYLKVNVSIRSQNKPGTFQIMVYRIS